MKRKNRLTSLSKTELINQRNDWYREYQLAKQTIDKLQYECIELRHRQEANMQKQSDRIQINIRTDEEGRAQIHRMASRYGMTVSEYIRQMSRWVERTRPALIIQWDENGGDKT